VGGAGFNGLLSGPRLTSFAKPGEAFKSDKPSRPFGAPESDDEDGSDDADEDGEDGSGGEDSSEDESEKGKDEQKTSPEDKKKMKLQKGETCNPSPLTRSLA
jgi:hypothetical protein